MLVVTAQRLSRLPIIPTAISTSQAQPRPLCITPTALHCDIREARQGIRGLLTPNLYCRRLRYARRSVVGANTAACVTLRHISQAWCRCVAACVKVLVQCESPSGRIAVLEASCCTGVRPLPAKGSRRPPEHALFRHEFPARTPNGKELTCGVRTETGQASGKLADLHNSL